MSQNSGDTMFAEERVTKNRLNIRSFREVFIDF